MQKPYQIQRQRALQNFEQRVRQDNPSLQMALPLAEVVGRLQQGMNQLAGLLLKQAMEETMAQEVRWMVGERHRRGVDRPAYRWGSERGYCVIHGQKLWIGRPRLRDKHHRELALGSYELFQRASLMEEAVWEKMMRQVSTRKYSELVQEFAQAYGIQKSTISEHFIEASRQKLQQLLERPLKALSLCAMVIDGTIFQSEHLMVAMGVTTGGQKLVLGLRQGASENAEVVKALLAEWQERGIDFDVPRLYVLDGSKALQTAVQRYAGPAAVLQRCQVHKIRNVISHLPESYSYAVKARMQNAYNTVDHTEAQQALQRLHRELQERNPSAARSLAEGLEETLSVHRLRVAPLLRPPLSTTNLIESAFSMVEAICRNVKKWAQGDHRLRWVASALLYAETRFNRLHGYRQIPFLVKELELLALRQGVKLTHVGAA